MQHRHQFRHLGHLHPSGQKGADRATHHHTNDNRGVTGHLSPQHGGKDGDQHTGDAVQVAPSGGLLIAQAAEGEDKQDRGRDIGNRNHTFSHLLAAPISGTSSTCAG